MAGVLAAATATGLRPMSLGSRVRHGTSDIVPVKTSGNGLMHTGRSLESGDRILIGIRRMWHRSTARNMPLITAGRKLDTPDRRSAAGQLYGIITTAGNAQKLRD